MRDRKAELRDIVEDVEAMDLPDGAYWAMINERLTGDPTSTAAHEMIADDPEYYGFEGDGGE